MTSSIEAIFFDVGGTLRATIKGKENSQDYLRSLQTFIGDNGDMESFLVEMRKREKTYRHWCKKTLRELPETELWSRFLLPDHPAAFVHANAITLNQMWRASRNNQIFPDAVETIKTLSTHGYRLGIISNTTSSVEAPRMLEENGLTQYFNPVILSCIFGRRKPHPSLFLEAARSVGILPQNCAYIGDNLARDLVGARQAGFGEVVIINMQGYQPDEFDPDDDLQEETITEMQPDHRIGRLSDLLGIYTGTNTEVSPGFAPRQPEHLYEISLSTMWGAPQAGLFNDTFTKARRLGFTGFELNNAVTPELYRQLDKNQFYVTTVHDPCPSDNSYAELKQADIALSSLDEAQRRVSVDNLKRSIELAVRLGSRSVVIHCGSVICNHARDGELRKMWKQGLKHTPQYQQVLAEFTDDREAHKAPHISQVLKSLEEVIGFAHGSGVALALENRNRYFDIPLPDELELFLALSGGRYYGFQFDIGHAYNQDALGTVPFHVWMERFQERLIGVHLHDVAGIQDHRVPGTGDLDFHRIAPIITDGVLCTLEIGPDASLDEIARGLELLVETGCIKKI
jgi:HAD superfamily hydrolase (TIGR01549 family)